MPCEHVAVQIQITGVAVVQAYLLNVSKSGLLMLGTRRLQRGLEVCVKMNDLLGHRARSLLHREPRRLIVRSRPTDR
jgi:hypothetical protein